MISLALTTIALEEVGQVHLTSHFTEEEDETQQLNDFVRQSFHHSVSAEAGDHMSTSAPALVHVSGLE